MLGALSPEAATLFARSEFLKRGVAVSESFTTNDPPGDHYFRQGGSCHSRVFEGNNYIHFHAGRGAWDGEISDNAPEIRIRQMTVNGEDIPESDCYSC